MFDINKEMRLYAQNWVSTLNEVPTDMIAKLIEFDNDDWREVTLPEIGDRVFIHSHGEIGEVIHIDDKLSSYETIYGVRLDDYSIVSCYSGGLSVEHDYPLPIWGTMWSFKYAADKYWISNPESIRVMSKLGFRIYISNKFGYFFGIDGTGCDFYDNYWIPLLAERMKGNDEI